MSAIGAHHALAIVTFRNLPNKGRHKANVTRQLAGIKPEPYDSPGRYTLRSSSDPRGRFRGGVVEGVGEAPSGGFAEPGAVGIALNGWANGWTLGTLTG